MENEHMMSVESTTSTSFEEESLLTKSADDMEMVQDEPNNDAHISYLWRAKLKSRNSFLTILEFLPLNRTQLH